MKLFRDLKVKLTPEEWGANAAAMAAEQAKLAEVQSELAQANTTFKARIRTHNDKLHELGEKVRSREETRAVECIEKPDSKRFLVEVYRLDTGELVETRPMTAAERHSVLQATLPGVSVKGPFDGDDEAN
jgi:hypothetical protein